jgi:hypothetical protein
MIVILNIMFFIWGIMHIINEELIFFPQFDIYNLFSFFTVDTNKPIIHTAISHIFLDGISKTDREILAPFFALFNYNVFHYLPELIQRVDIKYIAEVVINNNVISTGNDIQSYIHSAIENLVLNNNLNVENLRNIFLRIGMEAPADVELREWLTLFIKK